MSKIGAGARGRCAAAAGPSLPQPDTQTSSAWSPSSLIHGWSLAPVSAAGAGSAVQAADGGVSAFTFTRPRPPLPRAQSKATEAGLPPTPGPAVPPALHSPTCRAADPTLSAFVWKAPEGVSATHPAGGNFTSRARRVERRWWLLPDSGRLSSHQVPGICKVPSPLWCLCHSPR